MTLYPLKFKPIIKDKIWGGQKLNTVLNKNLGALSNGGESWEISAVPGDVSVVENGFLQGINLYQLTRIFTSNLLGNKVYERFGDNFPLLIKFIDAADNLSVQVHPDDKLAGERHNSFGKTEMWYVMQADKGAKLIAGFNAKLTREEYIQNVEKGTLLNTMAQHEVAEGDVFYIPAGRVHAIGAGILLAEIQQTSDVTYRIFDFNRKDAEGKCRELHTELAVDANDYNVYPDYKTYYEQQDNISSEVVHSDFFKTNLLPVKGEAHKDYSKLDSFVIYICVSGSAKVVVDSFEAIDLKVGESLLIPSQLNNVTIVSEDCKLLEVYM